MASLRRGYVCPVCQAPFSDLHAIARHIALKGDESHILWRLEHNLPEKVTIKDRAVITQVKIELFRNISLVIRDKVKEEL